MNYTLEFTKEDHDKATIRQMVIIYKSNNRQERFRPKDEYILAAKKVVSRISPWKYYGCEYPRLINQVAGYLQSMYGGRDGKVNIRKYHQSSLLFRIEEMQCSIAKGILYVFVDRYITKHLKGRQAKLNKATPKYIPFNQIFNN